jgi:hypothetical protein
MPSRLGTSLPKPCHSLPMVRRKGALVGLATVLWAVWAVGCAAEGGGGGSGESWTSTHPAAYCNAHANMSCVPLDAASAAGWGPEGVSIWYGSVLQGTHLLLAQDHPAARYYQQNIQPRLQQHLERSLGSNTTRWVPRGSEVRVVRLSFRELRATTDQRTPQLMTTFAGPRPALLGYTFHGVLYSAWNVVRSVDSGAGDEGTWVSGWVVLQQTFDATFDPGRVVSITRHTWYPVEAGRDNDGASVAMTGAMGEDVDALLGVSSDAWRRRAASLASDDPVATLLAPHPPVRPPRASLTVRGMFWERRGDSREVWRRGRRWVGGCESGRWCRTTCGTRIRRRGWWAGSSGGGGTAGGWTCSRGTRSRGRRTLWVCRRCGWT